MKLSVHNCIVYIPCVVAPKLNYNVRFKQFMF